MSKFKHNLNRAHLPWVAFILGFTTAILVSTRGLLLVCTRKYVYRMFPLVKIPGCAFDEVIAFWPLFLSLLWYPSTCSYTTTCIPYYYSATQNVIIETERLSKCIC